MTVELRVDYGVCPTRFEAVRSSKSPISHLSLDDSIWLCCGARLTSAVGCDVINPRNTTNLSKYEEAKQDEDVK